MAAVVIRGAAVAAASAVVALLLRCRRIVAAAVAAAITVAGGKRRLRGRHGERQRQHARRHEPFPLLKMPGWFHVACSPSNAQPRRTKLASRPSAALRSPPSAAPVNPHQHLGKRQVRPSITDCITALGVFGASIRAMPALDHAGAYWRSGRPVAASARRRSSSARCWITRTLFALLPSTAATSSTENPSRKRSSTTC